MPSTKTPCHSFCAPQLLDEKLFSLMETVMVAMAVVDFAIAKVVGLGVLMPRRGKKRLLRLTKLKRKESFRDLM